MKRNLIKIMIGLAACALLAGCAGTDAGEANALKEKLESAKENTKEDTTGEGEDKPSHKKKKNKIGRAHV